MRKLAVLVGVFAIQGCALVFHGTTKDVRFTSDPPGAKVVVAGVEGTTPATLMVKRAGAQGDPGCDTEDCPPLAATFLLAGHEPQVVELPRGHRSYGVLEGLLGGIVLGVPAALIDEKSGANVMLRPDEVHAVLVPAH